MVVGSFLGLQLHEIEAIYGIFRLLESNFQVKWHFLGVPWYWCTGLWGCCCSLRYRWNIRRRRRSNIRYRCILVGNRRRKKSLVDCGKLPEDSWSMEGDSERTRRRLVDMMGSSCRWLSNPDTKCVVKYFRLIKKYFKLVSMCSFWEIVISWKLKLSAVLGACLYLITDTGVTQRTPRFGNTNTVAT